MNKHSFIYGQDLSQDLPLVNLPSNNAWLQLKYLFDNHLEWGAIHFNNMEVSLNGTFVAQQNRILPEQDFVLPPNAYQLFDASWSSNIRINKHQSDGLGRNFIFGLQFKF